MDVVAVLKAGVLEELKGAKSEEGNGRFKNALILYSKAIFSLCDYIIAVNKLKLPEDHKERFEILDRYFPFIHRTVSKVFRKYVETYTKPSDKESCEGIKNALRELSDVEKLDEELKAALKKA